MLYQAHRGVCTQCPENTLPAFRKAQEQGYQIIEMDPRFTADGVCVLHHDATVNRTCRRADGSEIGEKTLISQIPYDVLRTLDAGLWFGEEFRGTKVPTLEETLALCKAGGTHVKLDNVFATFPMELQNVLFAAVEASGADVGFTCANLETVRTVAARFPEATVHYDGPVSEERILEVKALLNKNPLVVWLPVDSERTAWCKAPKATPELCAVVKKHAKLGLWILSDGEEETRAMALGADIIETPGELKPMQNSECFVPQNDNPKGRHFSKT